MRFQYQVKKFEFPSVMKNVMYVIQKVMCMLQI